MSSVSFHQQQCSLGLRGWTSPWLRERVGLAGFKELEYEQVVPRTQWCCSTSKLPHCDYSKASVQQCFLWHLWWSSGKSHLQSLWAQVHHGNAIWFLASKAFVKLFSSSSKVNNISGFPGFQGPGSFFFSLTAAWRELNWTVNWGQAFWIL